MALHSKDATLIRTMERGPSDGVSGVVKSAVRRAVISWRAIVNSAEKMYEHCHSNLTKNDCNGQRSFFLVNIGEIQRKRPASQVTAALAGTRLLHSVRCVSPGVIDTRLLSCFCEDHMSDTVPQQCYNMAYILPWQRRSLKLAHEWLEEAEPGDAILPTQPEEILDDESELKIEDLWKQLTDGLFNFKTASNI